MNAEDIAKKIDEMSLEDMLFASSTSGASGPIAGGDYDSLQGWKARLKISDGSTKRLIDWLVEAGRAERGIPGFVVRNKSRYPCRLTHAPDLAKRAAEIREQPGEG